MLSNYDLAVRSLNSRNTHLKLADRARVALKNLARDERPMPPDFMRDVQLAIYRRSNAVKYREHHFPSFNDLPQELQQQLRDDYPLSGYGMADMNTMLGLEKQAEETEARLKQPDLPEPSESAVEQMIQDYLAWRASRRTPTQPA